jgi:hypothetical protein
VVDQATLFLLKNHMAANILLIHRKDFEKFNGGEEDRFGFFRKDINKKLNTEAESFSPQTAYNYQRLNPEIEREEWKEFINSMTDRLFKRYHYLWVDRGGHVFGINDKEKTLLITDPEAFTVAQEILSV